MKHLLTLALSAACLLMSAQLSTLQKRLRASTIKDYLLLRYEPLQQTLSYETDPRRTNRSRQHTLDKDNASEFTARSEKINLDLTFINPLKYDISVSTKYREDEIYKNIGKFTESLNMVLTTVTDIKIKLNTDLKNKARNDTNMSKLKIGEDFKNSNLLSYSSSWYAWYFQLAQSYSTISADRSFTGFLKNVVDNSGEVYDKLNDSAANKKINKIIASYNSLKETENYQDLKKINSQLKKSCADHQRTLDDVTALCKSFKASLTKNVAFDARLRNKYEKDSMTQVKLDNVNVALNRLKLKPSANMVDTAYNNLKDKLMFYNYSVIVSNEFINQVSDEIQSEKKIIENMSAVIAEIDKIQYDNNLDAIILQEIRIDPAMTTNIVVKVALKDGEDDKTTNSCEINISDYSAIIPEFSIGLAFTNITYPTYGLSPVASGSFSITQNSEGITNYSLLAMLKLLPNILKSNYYPIFQFGAGLAGVNKTVPVVGGGIGVRMFQPTDLAITFGAIWHWQKALSNLKPGDSVTSSDQLDKNLHFNFVTLPAFYLGIQYNF